MSLTTNVFNFSHPRGDTLIHEIIVKNTDETVKNITGATVRYRVANRGHNKTVLLTKTVGDGVTLTDPAQGVLQCTLTAAEVVALTAQQYAYECELTLAGHVHTVLRGTITFTGSVVQP